MNEIIEKYHLKPGSKLVSQQIGTNGVDCWFDLGSNQLKRQSLLRQHRCIDFEDYTHLVQNMTDKEYQEYKRRRQ